MGSSSKSSSSSVNKAYNFNNIDYSGGGGGEGGSLAKNINLAESELTVGDVSTTDHGAVSGALDFAATASSQNATALMALGDRAFDDVEDSRELTGDLFTGAVDSVNAANRETLQYMNQNTDRALAFANQSTRSEAGQIAENLTKYMMVGGAGLVVLIFIVRKKG
ncbi:hypothetical protein [Marinobacter sp. LN3S78]|uniref:hypothetical protein n=1 Tax=Marinobacter sp. LN3S78 TaxID=3382300 RepID=UPI00387A9DF1